MIIYLFIYLLLFFLHIYQILSLFLCSWPSTPSPSDSKSSFNSTPSLTTSIMVNDANANAKPPPVTTTKSDATYVPPTIPVTPSNPKPPAAAPSPKNAMKEMQNKKGATNNPMRSALNKDDDIYSNL